MGIIVLLETLGVLLGGIREPTRRDDHPALWTVEVERRDRRVELLDDRSPDRLRACLHSTMIARRVPSTTSSMMTSRPSSAVRSA